MIWGDVNTLYVQKIITFFITTTFFWSAETCGRQGLGDNTTTRHKHNLICFRLFKGTFKVKGSVQTLLTQSVILTLLCSQCLFIAKKTLKTDNNTKPHFENKSRKTEVKL